MLRKGAGLLQGSRSSVVRVSTAEVGGLGFDSQWLPMHFVQFVSILIYHQLLTTSSYCRLLLISTVQLLGIVNNRYSLETAGRDNYRRRRENGGLDTDVVL